MAAPKLHEAGDAFTLSLAVCALAWIATRFGIGASAGVAAVWPVNAVILVALLRAPPRRWPVLILAATIGDFAPSLLPLAQWPAQFGLAVCDVIEATVAAAALLRLLGPGLDMSKRRDLAIFGLVALGASAVSGVPASLVFSLAHGAALSDTLPNWILGDTLGLVIVAPALLAVQTGDLKALFSAKARLRTVLVLGGEVAIVAAVCVYGEPLLKALIPVALMLPAIELGMTGAALGVLLGGATMIGLTPADPALVHAQLRAIQYAVDIEQLFLAVAVVASLGLAATLADRRRLQVLMQAAARQFQVLTENANDMVAACDPEGRFEYVSPACRDMVGFDPSELIGRPALSLVHPEDRVRLELELQKVLAGGGGGGGDRLQYRAVCKDGRVIWVEGRPKARLDAITGEAVGFTDVIRDVTASQVAEAALRDARADLARVARVSALGAFSASLAHEINQPLAALVTNSDVALRMLSGDTPNIAMAERAVMRSGRDARRASEIIARMRAMITKGPPVATDFDLNEAISEVLTLTEGEQQRLDVTAEADLTKDVVMIRGDRVQFQQVVLNLVQNAIEAMRSNPQEERRLWVRSVVVENGNVMVEVEDRGPGLDPATVDHMFERLFTTKEGGTGLGLTISKSIIEAHGGRIWAEAAEPLGAIFRFQLPQGDVI